MKPVMTPDLAAALEALARHADQFYAVACAPIYADVVRAYRAALLEGK